MVTVVVGAVAGLVLATAAGAYPCNDAAAAILRRKGFQGVLRTMPLGVDPPPPGTGVRHAKGPAPFRIGCAGTLARHKGQHLLLEAVANEPGWAIELVGDGPEREALAAQAELLGMSERVKFWGFRPVDAMDDFYNEVDVLAVPSVDMAGWAEQFGRVAAEAMACGVPVVASDSGSLPEVVGDAATVVAQHDPDALHKALAELAESPLARAELADKGRRRARDFRWPAVAAQQVRLYRDVLAGAAHRAPGDAALPRLHVVIVAFGAPELLGRALAALRRPGPAEGHGSAAPGLAVTVVDNSSSAAVRAVSLAQGAHYVDPGENLGFGAGVNQVLRKLAGSGTDVLLLNPDAEVERDTVARLQERLHAEARLACTAPAQVDAAGTEQRVRWPFPSPWRYWAEALGAGRLLRSNGFLTGSVLMLNGAALDDIGHFDESYFLYAEETDWQRRARNAGWGVRFCPDLHAVHQGAATSRGDPRGREIQFAAGQEHYVRKWWGAGGWRSARAAVVVGALARALVLRGRRRAAALRRAGDHLVGPARLARRRGRRRAGTPVQPAPPRAVT